MPSGYRTPTATASLACEMYVAGHSFNYISKTLGVDRETVRNICKRAGLYEPRIVTTKPLLIPTRYQIERLFHDGWTNKVIAYKTGATQSQVERIVAVLNRFVEKVQTPNRVLTTLSDAQLAKLDRARGPLSRSAYIRNKLAEAIV